MFVEMLLLYGGGLNQMMFRLWSVCLFYFPLVCIWTSDCIQTFAVLQCSMWWKISSFDERFDKRFWINVGTCLITFCRWFEFNVNVVDLSVLFVIFKSPIVQVMLHFIIISNCSFLNFFRLLVFSKMASSSYGYNPIFSFLNLFGNV